MDFEKKMPDWENEGTEPSAELKTNGFQGGYKPPAGIFNWFWSLITNAIKEIQENLSNVDNTKDSEKNVAFASEANVGRKVKYPFILRLNGGDTENTDLWNYDGSVSKSVNLTPEKLGARPTEKPNIVVTAVREVTDDGKEIYTATDSNITELYDGLEITIIPNETNETLQPRLKINDFDDKGIRLALSSNCAATTTVTTKYIQANRPITFKYHANMNLGIQGQGAWIFADRIKTSAQDLYGDVPIESGGTGASTAKEAITNLGVYPVGSVYIASTNSNPANTFGGTWELVDKKLRSMSLSASSTNPQDWFVPSDNTSDYEVRVAIHGDSITFELDLKSKNAVATETDVLFGTFNFAKLGIDGLNVTQRCIAYSDDGNTYVMVALSSSTGEFKAYDFRPSGLSASNSFKVTFCVTANMDKMLDDYCNKFYWKRTK